MFPAKADEDSRQVFHRLGHSKFCLSYTLYFSKQGFPACVCRAVVVQEQYQQNFQPYWELVWGGFLLPKAVKCVLRHVCLMYQQCWNVVQLLTYHPKAVVTSRTKLGKEHQRKPLIIFVPASISLAACGGRKDSLPTQEWKKYLYYFVYHKRVCFLAWGSLCWLQECQRKEIVRGKQSAIGPRKG